MRQICNEKMKWSLDDSNSEAQWAIDIFFEKELNREYYMVARRYEFYVRVART